MAYRLICVVGMVETHGSHLYDAMQQAREAGDWWLGDEEYSVECEIADGNYEAAEVPTYYVIENADTGETVFRSNEQQEFP